MAVIYTHKRGSSFEFVGVVPIYGLDGLPADATAWTPTASIMTLKGDKVSDLEAVWLDTSERILRIAATTGTQNWPLGVLQYDVRFESTDGYVVTTETVKFQVIERVT